MQGCAGERVSYKSVNNFKIAYQRIFFFKYKSDPIINGGADGGHGVCVCVCVRAVCVCVRVDVCYCFLLVFA